MTKNSYPQLPIVQFYTLCYIKYVSNYKHNKKTYMSKMKDEIENQRVERAREYAYDYRDNKVFGSHKNERCDEEKCYCGKFSNESCGVRITDNETSESILEKIRIAREYNETN